MKRQLSIIGVVFFGSLLVATNANAQWQSTSGPYGGRVQCIAAKGGYLFAGTLGAGIFRSSDGGVSWVPANSGIDHSDFSAIVVSGSNIFAASYGGGVFLSTNEGENWVEVNNGLIDHNVTSLALGGNDLYAGSNGVGGVYRTTNNGASWTSIGDSLPQYTLVSCIAVHDTMIFIGTQYTGLFKSTDNGATWMKPSLFSSNALVRDVVSIGSSLFAAYDAGGVRKSTDGGDRWYASNNGLTSTMVNVLVAFDSVLYAGAFWDTGALCKSTNQGATWSPIDLGSTDARIRSILKTQANLFVGSERGVARSTNNGATWLDVSRGIAATQIMSIGRIGSVLLAGESGYGLSWSSDKGSTWARPDSGLPEATVRAIAGDSLTCFAGTSMGLYRSTDNGRIWKNVDPTTKGGYFYAIAINDDYTFAASERVFRSKNRGETWTVANNGLAGRYVNSFATFGENIYAATDSGVFVSHDEGSDWAYSSVGMPDYSYVHRLVVSGGFLFAGAGNVFRSTDAGASWTITLGPPITSGHVWELAANGTRILATDNNRGVFVSTNAGDSWIEVNEGLINEYKRCLAMDETDVYAGGDHIGVWRRALSEIVSSAQDPQGNESPLLSTLEQNYPNPFNPQTRIRFILVAMENVRLDVFDILGRRVRTLVNRQLPAGRQEIEWDGKGDHGEQLAGGVYVCRVIAGSFVSVKKMLMLK